MWRYATLPVLTKTYRKLLFNNLSIVWKKKKEKKKKKTFVRRVHRCCFQSLMQIGQIIWEDFEKVGLQHFVNLQKKKKKKKKIGGNGRGLCHKI